MSKFILNMKMILNITLNVKLQSQHRDKRIASLCISTPAYTFNIREMNTTRVGKIFFE